MAAQAGDAGAGEPLSPFYIPATQALAAYRAHVLKQNDCFAVLDAFGNAQATAPAAEGLFFEDTRHVSQLVLTIDGARPLLLSSSVSEDNAVLAADLANPDLMAGGRLRLARDTVHILSSTLLGVDALFAQLELRNFGSAVAGFSLAVHFDADFVDLFEVRGTVRRRRGELLADEPTEDGTVLAYRGLDRVVRRTRFTFDPPPDAAEKRRATWTIELPPGGTRLIQVTARCQQGERSPHGHSREASLARLVDRRAERLMRAADLYSSNETFNDLLNRSRADLDMLVTETPQGPYAYAGIPWFSTAFGRDGLITALECLWLDPAIAAGTLRFLAARQATARDAGSDAEPGKILHETRRGEMAMLGEVPFRCYYGSVDSTPLFVMLAAAYHARTGDLELVRSLWPNIRAALGWMTEYGDIDGDGFLEYDRKSVNGLVNQGWKDSSDAVFHADGRLAEAPIALAEVQAYAYGAYLGASGLAAALDDAPLAAELAAAGERLRQRFEAAFWQEELGTYALALDREKRPCRVRTSNAGQVLLSGIAAPERAARVAAGLMAPPSFTGWGVRTLAEGEARYNPMSYHNGSVWPHDNALIAMGFARYGLRQPLVRQLTGLFDSALFTALQRLPELFCGFARRPGTGPTAYPVACLPQAWSSAAVFAMLGALLGVSFDRSARRISLLRPTLPPWLDTLRLSNLRLGDAAVDLLLERREEDVALHVTRRDGEVEILLTT
ncbi:MAG: glycogen debranching N-terminal domain-containing protein [Stellaceae bacterium]